MYRRIVETGSELYQHRETNLTDEDEGKISCALHGHRWAAAWKLPELSIAVGPVNDVVNQTIQLVGRAALITPRCPHSNS